jgi:putative FmdB family regulatory protein
MPTYQYACTECDHAFEQFQSFSDDALTECPECAGRLRKLFNAVGVVFKGSGFYRTDSREKQPSGDSSSSSSGESGSSGSGSTEKKPTEKKSSSDSGSSTKAAAAPATS